MAPSSSAFPRAGNRKDLIRLVDGNASVTDVVASGTIRRHDLSYSVAYTTGTNPRKADTVGIRFKSFRRSYVCSCAEFVYVRGRKALVER